MDRCENCRFFRYASSSCVAPKAVEFIFTSTKEEGDGQYEKRSDYLVDRDPKKAVYSDNFKTALSCLQGLHDLGYISTGNIKDRKEYLYNFAEEWGVDVPEADEYTVTDWESIKNIGIE